MKKYLHSLLKEEEDPVDKKYLEYIKKGFPKRKGKKKDVLIVGAGMAGMVAASILKKSGHNVTIVEANTRIGGRIKTFRNSEEKKYWEDPLLYAEAGAMRLPDFHYMLMEYCKQLKVDLEPFYYVSVDKEEALKNKKEAYENYKKHSETFPKKTFNSFLFVNYKQVRQHAYNDSININELLNYNLQESVIPENPKEKPVPGENQNAGVLLTNALQPLIDFIAINPKENWPKLIDKLGEYSMRRFLKEYTNYSENAIEMIGVLQNLESRMSYDFIQSFIESNIIKNDTVFWQVIGGTDVITEKLFAAYNLAEITHLDTKMTDIYIKEGEEKVRISTEIEIKRAASYYKNIGYSIQEVPVSKMAFDEVIITIPFSALRMVHVWPEFSQEKRKAIRELHYDSATKVLIEFKERWWEQDPYNIIGGGTITDLSNRFMYYPSQDINGKGHGLMLACYCWADDARKWDSMSHKDRYIFALDNIAVAHAPDDIEEQRRIKNLSIFDPKASEDSNYVDGIKGAATVSWMQNPYAFGEAAIFSPGQLNLLQEHIEKPEWEGKVHFAGEHASLKHAWIEGAVESGIRAALEVNETPVKL